MGEFADQVKAMKESLEAKGRTVQVNVVQAVRNATLRIERQVKVSMKTTVAVAPDALTESGNRMGHWVGEGPGRGYKSPKGRKWHPSSTPGFAPNPDSGDLMASYTHEYLEEGRRGKIGSRLKYARRMEFGDSNMAARPALGPAVQMVSKLFRDDLKFSMAQPQIEAEND